MPLFKRKCSTFQPSDEIVVKELANLLRGRDGAKVITGETKFVLTASVVNCLSRCFEAHKDADAGEIVELPVEHDSRRSEFGFQENVNFLYNFTRDVLALEIKHGTGTVQGSINVSFFKNLKFLELKRIPIHLFVGLHYLRTHLQMITCMRCLHCLEDVFVSCGGDRSSPFSWPELLGANLSFNSIEYLGTSLRLLCSLVSLNVSHNRLKDTNGIEYLNKLEYLNLSYNHLQVLPRLSVLAFARLKVLYMSNNRLESLDGLDKFSNLQEIDVAYNCLLTHCRLSSLMQLASIKSVTLTGNPLSFHQQHRLLSAHHLHINCLSSVCLLDGKSFSKNEIKEAINFKRNCVGLRNTCCEFSKISDSEVCNQSSFSAFASTAETSENVRSNMVISEHVCGVQNCASDDCDINFKLVKGKKKPRRTPFVRDVLIDETIPILATSEQSHVELAEALKCSVKSDHPLEVSDDHLQTKQEIEKCRERHGKEWLIIGSKLSVLPSAVRLEDTDDMMRCASNFVVTNPEKTEAVNNNVKMTSSSQVNDDVIVLKKESESSTSFPGYSSSCLIDSSDERQDESDEDETELLLPLIVHCERPGAEELTLLLIVSESHIKEIDSINGRTIDRLELKCIQLAEKRPSKVTIVDGVECKLPKVHLAFNYVRQDRKERVYIMEDDSCCEQLLDVLKPIVEANTYAEMTFGALQCLKCSAHFSKDVAKKVIRNSQQPHDDIIVLSSSSNSAKNYPTKVNACPNCGSEMVIELGYHSPNKAMFENSISSTVKPDTLISTFGPSIGGGSSALSLCSQSSSKNSTTAILCSSCPNSTMTQLSQDHFQANGFLEKSLKGSSTINGCSGKLQVVSDKELICQQNRCNLVEVEVEIHNSYHFDDHFEPRVSSSLKSSLPNNTGDTSGLKRTESDITILSNPSQSSILVVANIGTELELSLDAISENSLESHRQIVVPTSSDNMDLTKCLNIDQKKCLSPYSSKKLDNASSGSPTESACTALEKCGVDSYLSESSESFASENAIGVNTEHNDKSDSFDYHINTAASDRIETPKIVMRNAVVECDSNHKEINRLTKLARKNWSWQHSDIIYSTEDFGDIDHRLKLFLELEVLNVEEDLVAVLRVGVIPYLKGIEWPGLLVISKENIYIMKITGPETEQPQYWLQKFASYPSNTVSFINIRPGSQAFQLEFGPKSVPSCFTFLTRDADYCNNFVSYMMEKIQSKILDVSEIQLGLDGDETLQTLKELLMVPDNDDNTDDVEAIEEVLICLYTMGYWMATGKTAYEPISFVVTSTEIILFCEDFHWPLPNLVLPSNDILSRPPLTLLGRCKIRDLTAIELLDGHPLKLMLKFVDEEEEERQEFTWNIAMETERTLELFIQALRSPWEKMFGIDLHVMQSS